MRSCPEVVVSIGSSQCLRFIDEINGVKKPEDKIREIKRQIRQEKKLPKSRGSTVLIRELYRNLYELLFQKDYICVVMDKKSDYDRANMGFTVNGIRFRRFLGTNGGIKTSTIVYINEELYPELKKRLDNGRNKNVPLVPAKLEAYQALICSGSTPVPEPNGIIVVNDCITHFKENVIMIDDEPEGEPVMKEINDHEFEHNDSDGFGLMLPSYSAKVNKFLSGCETPLSGMNSRLAWEKGMIYTFDFVDFADKVAGTYEITDAWGDKRDVRDAEVIFTTSMLKLWNCYDNWEDYYCNCKENHYQLSVPKTTPDKLESMRNMNYQFLQSYEFTDDELVNLCQPTIDEINDVLGLDYRKSLVFLAGFGLNDKNVWNDSLDYCVRALMIDKRMIDDPFVRHKIYNMIEKRINDSKKGCIRVDANFAMISGDPYALAQSMFGLEVTGLLKQGEVYHKYWIDKGSDEILCYRAPMTCANNIRKMRLCDNEQTAYWYKYINTALIYNAWDSSCEAMNGADKDGDTNMCTDDPVLLKNTKTAPTIVCVQRSAQKKIVTEDDIITSNKLAFNDDIGVITNHVTAMFERQASFEKASKEYRALAYRIMCGQLYQQNSIDRAKGIISKPMPSYWYNLRENITRDEDLDEKAFNYRIAAARKPYFMTYVYPDLKRQYRNYCENSTARAIIQFYDKGCRSIDDVYDYGDKTSEMSDFLEYYEKYMPTGNSPCVVNRICKIFENEFDGHFRKSNSQFEFDYSILKSNADYSRISYNKVLNIYEQYQNRLGDFQKKKNTEKLDATESQRQKTLLTEWFRQECEKVCSNEDELCDIVLDICYSSERSKQFAWDICGETILKNLLKRHDNIISYPSTADGNYDFMYGGAKFIMNNKKVGDGV